MKSASAARFLVIVWALLLAMMPLTEHLWTFDRFLRGGSQDFELSLCTLVAVLCLVLLLAQHARAGWSLVIALRRRVGTVVSEDLAVRRRAMFDGFERAWGALRVLEPAAPACHALPMQI